MLKFALPLTFRADLVLGRPAASRAGEARSTAEEAQALVAEPNWLVWHDGYIFGCGIYKP